MARGIAYVERDAGQGSSHAGEWLALLYAVRIAITLDAQAVDLIGDSVAIIRIARGEAKVRAGDEEYLASYRALIRAIPDLKLRHITRSKNLAGIALAKAHPR